jgi:hypothetical protein
VVADREALDLVSAWIAAGPAAATADCTAPVAPTR